MVLDDLESEPRLLDHVLAKPVPRPVARPGAVRRDGVEDRALHLVRTVPGPHLAAARLMPAATAAFIRPGYRRLAEHDHARELDPVAHRADQLEREDVLVTVLEDAIAGRCELAPSVPSPGDSGYIERNSGSSPPSA